MPKNISTKKVLLKILVYVCVLMVIFFVTLTMYINVHAKTYLEREISGMMRHQLRMKSLRYQFPFIFYAEDVSLEGVMFSQKVKITLNVDSLKDFLRSQFHNKPLAMSLHQLDVHRAQMRFPIKIHDSKESIDIKDVYLTIGEITFPLTSGQTKFDFYGRIEQFQRFFSESEIKGSGWIDVINRDMQAVFHMNQIDRRADIMAQVHSEKNQVHVDGHLKIINPVSDMHKDDKLFFSSIIKLIAGDLAMSNVAVGIDFQFEINMDDFQIREITYRGTVETKSIAQ